MEAIATPLSLVEYEAHRSARVTRLKTEAARPEAVVREIAKIVRWLGTEQPMEAIGPIHGIYSDGAFALHAGAYVLRTVVHTATGKPAIQLVKIEDPIDGRDSELFLRIVDRVLQGQVLTSWEAPDCFAVALKVKVHPTLVRTVTHNYRTMACSGARERNSKSGCPISCGDCPYRFDRQAKFIVPPGWHV